ncbi:MAG: SIS domain-containing protein [Oscillospiraceae bacterium]|nr:SIS domain-containing protein [Oscillospiraceae bacterium]
MYLTEAEILDTPLALASTCSYFKKRDGDLAKFFTDHKQRKFTVFGCGSSFMLAKSAATLLASMPDTAASAIPAGDYILNHDFWLETVRGSVVILLSRSGMTSEMVWAIKHIKKNLDCPAISITMKADSDLAPLCDLNLVLDWCYDESVCQTRTVTNLYTASLLLAAKYAGKDSLRESVLAAAENSGAFNLKYRPMLQEIAAMDWDNVVVLADGPVSGIAEEGALAFTEIAMLPGRCFHLLDYRHGPIVVSGGKTLTLVLLCPGEGELQGKMVQDVMARGSIVVTISDQAENLYGAAAHVQITGVEDFAAWGILFIYVAQMTALLKALALGGNPDQPQGLDAYISL